MRELSDLRQQVESWTALRHEVQDARIMLEMAQAEEDEDTGAELVSELDRLQKVLEERIFQLALSGKHDRNDAILAIHAGEGGTEAQDWASMMLRIPGAVSARPATNHRSSIRRTPNMAKLLEIRDLRANIGEKEILKGLSLSIEKGEVHAIMGPNGSGKSTLANVLMGSPSYTVTGGEVLFKGENILPLAPDVRARMGLFLAFQYPVAVPGVT